MVITRGMFSQDCLRIWKVVRRGTNYIAGLSDEIVPRTQPKYCLFVCINSQYCGVGYRTPIVVTMRKFVDWARKQRVAQWDCAPYAIKLLRYGPSGTVGMRLCGCVGVWCVRLVTLVWCICIYAVLPQTEIFLVGELTRNCWDFRFRNPRSEILNRKY